MPSSRMNRTTLACHCTSQPCTMLSVPCGTRANQFKRSPTIIHAPPITPIAGTTHAGSATLPARHPSGKNRSRHVDAVRNRRSIAQRHSTAQPSVNRKLMVNVSMLNGAVVSPHIHALIPMMPKVTGIALAAAAGAFTPATQEMMNPGSVNSMTATTKAPVSDIAVPSSPICSTAWLLYCLHRTLL